jgi:hypothetical protein
VYPALHLRNMAVEDTAAVVAVPTVVGAAVVPTAVVVEAARITAEAAVGTTAELRLVRIAAELWAEWRVGIVRTDVRAETLRAVTADRPTAAHVRTACTVDARQEILRTLATAVRLLLRDATVPTEPIAQDTRTA